MVKKVTPIKQATESDYPPAPPHVRPEHLAFYRSLITEVLAVRQAVTRADFTMICTAASCAQGEEDARGFAAQAQVDGNASAYDKFTKLAQGEARAKQAALGSLGLTGDRRGAKKSRLAAHAQNAEGVTTPTTGQWNIL